MPAPPPPPPPPPPPAPLRSVGRAAPPPPPPPPPPSTAGMSRGGPPPPPPPSLTSAAPKPPPSAAPIIKPKAIKRPPAPLPPPPPSSILSKSKKSAAAPPPPSNMRIAGESGLLHMTNVPPAPPMAPDFPDTLRYSEHQGGGGMKADENKQSPVPVSKFPSFTLDDVDDLAIPGGGDLHDITNNMRNTNRNSTYVLSSSNNHHTNPVTMTTTTSGGETTTMTNTMDNTMDTDHDLSTLNSNMKQWDKPIDFDTMTSLPTMNMNLNGSGSGSGSSGEDDEDNHVGFDVPDRLTIGPGAVAARLDLHRCTIKVHRQLVDQIKTNSMKSPSEVPIQTSSSASKKGNLSNTNEISRCQGELWLKSRVPMRGWKKRYGSIVDHQYFGPVLFLFKYDTKGNVTLTNSMMIVLVDSHVRLGKNTTTKDREYRCEFVLKTTKRRYTIAANHTMRRDYWLRNLESIQQHISTNNTNNY